MTEDRPISMCVDKHADIKEFQLKIRYFSFCLFKLAILNSVNLAEFYIRQKRNLNSHNILIGLRKYLKF